MAISKIHQHVADGVFRAELNEFLTKELNEEGYAGVQITRTPNNAVHIVISASKTKEVVGEKGRRLQELTMVITKRFGFEDGKVRLFAERIFNRGLSAVAQVESLKFKLIEGLAVRRAAYSILRYSMESGAKGCCVQVSGKLRQQRAQVMKFVDGYMKHAGEPLKFYVDRAVRHLRMRQGTLGLAVTIMLPHDPTGKAGARKPLPDVVTVSLPKEAKKVNLTAATKQ